MEKAEPMTYTIKTILFMKRRVPIMMQNQNGPCPLLALANILLLRNQIQLSPDAPSISQASRGLQGQKFQLQRSQQWQFLSARGTSSQ